MKIEIKATILKLREHSGTGKKSGKPYSFPSLSFVDGDANVFDLNFSKELQEDKKLMTRLAEVQNEEATLTINLYQKGFSLGGSIIGIEL